MAIKDNRLKEFFAKQKVGAFNALISKDKPTPKALDIEVIPTPTVVDSSTEQQLPVEIKREIEPIIRTLSENKGVQATNTSLQTTPFEPLAIREQTVSKPLAIREQTVSKPLAIRKRSVSVPLAEPLAEPLANSDEILINDLIIFSKKERELLSLIFWQCRDHGTLISPAIGTEEIRKNLKISAERVRNLIHRLIKKGGLKIVQYRSGQSAYRVFELPKSVYQLMIDQQNFGREPLAEPLANPLANAHSSSSYNIYTTTALPEDWKKINFDILGHIGFSVTQVHQLYESRVTQPDIVQDSINRFAYSLEYNNKVKAYIDPLNVLMGVLRKGQRWIEPNYVSPKELALRQMLEDKRKQKEQRDVMIKELIELEFPDWKRKLTEDEIKTIVPEDVRKTNLTAAINASLRTYFIEKVLLPRVVIEEPNNE